MTRFILPLVALVALGGGAVVAFSLAVAPLPAAHAAAPLLAAHAASPAREIPITVQGGYSPYRVEVTAGERVRLVFTRAEYTGCTREVVFPELGLRKELPTNQAIAIDLPDLAPGTYTFHCGMSMIHGTVVVSAPKG